MLLNQSAVGSAQCCGRESQGKSQEITNSKIERMQSCKCLGGSLLGSQVFGGQQA